MPFKKRPDATLRRVRVLVECRIVDHPSGLGRIRGRDRLGAVPPGPGSGAATDSAVAAPVPHAASAESVMKSSGFTDQWPRLDSWGQPAVGEQDGEQDGEQAAEQQGDQPCGAHE